MAPANTSKRLSYPGKQTGVSLVELMITVAIALIGVLIMFQVLDNWDKRKRTTASGSDAQIAGSIGLFALERDLKLAGYGFGGSPSMGCTVNVRDSLRPTTNFSFTLAPVIITDGASGAPDRITTLYGNSANASSTQTYTASTATSKRLNVRAAIRRGELLIAADTIAANGCALVEVTDNTNADTFTINHASGTYTNYLNKLVDAYGNPTATSGSVTARYNGLVQTLTSGRIFNMGIGPRRNIWEIRANRYLIVTDDLHYNDTNGPTPPAYSADGVNDWTEIADGIVDLQAQYGISTSTTCSSINTWQSTVPADWTTVCAIRVALLARSQQFEKSAITTDAPQWAGGAFTMTNIDGTAGSSASGTPNDWRHYRFRVYETIVPLRNVSWGLGKY